MDDEQCTARRDNGTRDPESCNCEKCRAWREARWDVYETEPELANPDW